MVLGIIKKTFGDYNAKELKKLWPLVEEVAEWEDEIAALTDEQLAAKTPEFRARLADDETLDDILPEAFAVCREASRASRSQEWLTEDKRLSREADDDVTRKLPSGKPLLTRFIFAPRSTASRPAARRSRSR